LANCRTPLGWQQSRLFFSVADHFARHGPAINAGEVLFDRRCEQ
jgi:hypothetical protein